MAMGARRHEIDADYQAKKFFLVGVLKGAAVMVVADLSRHLHTPLSMDWMAVSSYGAGTKSTGVVRILKDLDADVTGRDVLIVEDIIDSGLTLSWLREPSGLLEAQPLVEKLLLPCASPEALKVPGRGQVRWFRYPE